MTEDAAKEPDCFEVRITNR